MKVWYSPNLLYSIAPAEVSIFTLYCGEIFLFVIDVALCTSLICDFQDKKTVLSRGLFHQKLASYVAINVGTSILSSAVLSDNCVKKTNID